MCWVKLRNEFVNLTGNNPEGMKMSASDWIYTTCMIMILLSSIDSLFFEKRRYKKRGEKYKKEVTDGIIEELKKSDQVLVINSSGNAVVIQRSDIEQ
jgi:predicted histidine transporter YuiF (NhaC family)